MNSVDQLKQSVIVAYASIIFSILAGLFYTPWMISQIGRDDFGLYSLVSVFISYFLIDFGIGQVISTYVAKNRASKDFDSLRRIVGVCYKFFFLLTILISLTLFAIYFFIDDIFASLSPDQGHKFKVIYIIAGFFSVVCFPLMPLNGIITAFEKFVVLKVLDFVQKLLSVSLIIICLLNGWGLYALVAVNGLVGFGIGLYKLAYTKRNLHISLEAHAKLDKSLVRELMSFSGWVFIMGLAQRFIIGSGPTILGMVSGASAIAVFSIAMTLEGYIWMFSNAVNGLFIPKVAQYIEDGATPRQLTDRMITVGRLQLLIIGTIVGGLIALGASFINLWVGPQFRLSYITALLLISPQLILVTQEIANTLLWVKNLVKYRCISYLTGTVLNVGLGLLLSKFFGVVGCGIGVFCSLTLICIILNIIYIKKLHLSMESFFYNCHLKILPLLSIPVALIIGAQTWLVIDNWYKWLGMAVLFCAMEFVMAFLALSHDEKKLLLPVFFNKFEL